MRHGNHPNAELELGVPGGSPSNQSHFAVGFPIFSGVTPARVAINAQTFGTYIRVSAGSESEIAVKDFAPLFVIVRRTRPSPALYAASTSAQLPNLPCKTFKYRAAARADFSGSVRSSGKDVDSPIDCA